MRKTLYVAIGALVSVFVLVLLLCTVPHLRIQKRDPVSGLSYQIPLATLFNKDFTLIVRKQTAEDARELEQKNAELVANLHPPIQQQVNAHGIPYEHYYDEVCFPSDTFTVSLDPKANEGKSHEICDDTYGLVQDDYYVTVDNNVYVFTTDYPTRIAFHDFNLGEPARITEEDFQSLIESLHKTR